MCALLLAHTLVPLLPLKGRVAKPLFSPRAPELRKVQIAFWNTDIWLSPPSGYRWHLQYMPATLRLPVQGRQASTSRQVWAPRELGPIPRNAGKAESDPRPAPSFLMLTSSQRGGVHRPTPARCSSTAAATSTSTVLSWPDSHFQPLVSGQFNSISIFHS